MSFDLERLSHGLLPAFTGVRSLLLEKIDLIGNDRCGAAFGRIFAAMFANLQKLRIVLQAYRGQVAPRLDQFRNLRKCDIVSEP